MVELRNGIESYAKRAKSLSCLEAEILIGSFSSAREESKSCTTPRMLPASLERVELSTARDPTTSASVSIYREVRSSIRFFPLPSLLPPGITHQNLTIFYWLFRAVFPKTRELAATFYIARSCPKINSDWRRKSTTSLNKQRDFDKHFATSLFCKNFARVNLFVLEYIAKYATRTYV